MSQKPTDLCNEATFSQSYQEHVDAVYHYIYYKCGDESMAEDLTQDAFVKLWNKCKDIPFGKARAFLFTVAKNAFFNIAAHKKVQLKYEQRQSDTSEVETPGFILEEKEFEQQLNEAINNLTEAQRTVFLLNRIDGMKYREIADMLGISQKAVEKRMSGALLKLRELYKDI